MNKRKLLIVVVLLAIIGIGFFIVTQPRKTATSTPSTVSPSQATQLAPSTQTNQSATPGKYVDYDQQIVASTTGTRLLFFHAPWCPQCRALDTSIKASDLPEGVTIFKVDYDSNQKLRQKYGVTIQTTIVKLSQDGETGKKYVAYQEPNFAAVKENLLQ